MLENDPERPILYWGDLDQNNNAMVLSFGSRENVPSIVFAGFHASQSSKWIYTRNFECIAFGIVSQSIKEIFVSFSLCRSFVVLI